MSLSSERKKSLEFATLQYMEDMDAATLEWLASRGIDSDTAISNGLGLVKRPIQGHGPATNRLSIPYLTDDGPVVMNFRCLADHICKDVGGGHSKYWRERGQESRLYGVQSYFTPSQDIHICEGELDTIILKDVVGLPAIGVPGSTNWKTHWRLIFTDFDRVFVWADGDKAGNGMLNKFQKELGTRAIHVRLPEGKDVNALYLECGAEHLRRMIK